MSKNKKVLVTGGAGFIGSHIVDALIKRRIRVYVVDDLSSGKKSNLNPNARFYKMSITNPEFPKLVRRLKPDVIFHLAAHLDVSTSVVKPEKDAKINILGSLNVIQGANMAGTKKIIFTSTGGAMYSDNDRVPWSEKQRPCPMSPYAVAKRATELYLDYARVQYGIPYVVLRLANIYGPRQDFSNEGGVVAIFSDLMLRGKQPKIYGTGQQTRDFVYVGDVVRAAMMAMTRSTSGVYNIGTGRKIDINSLFKKIKKITGSDALQKRFPSKPGEVMDSVLSYRLAEKKLGWRPKVKLDDGLKKTVEWFRKK